MRIGRLLLSRLLLSRGCSALGARSTSRRKQGHVLRTSCCHCIEHRRLHGSREECASGPRPARLLGMRGYL
eukprot:683688-Pyramimonas_sp.AAC.1